MNYVPIGPGRFGLSVLKKFTSGQNFQKRQLTVDSWQLAVIFFVNYVPPFVPHPEGSHMHKTRPCLLENSPRNGQVSFGPLGVCGVGVVIPAPKFGRGALRVEDEWTTECLRHRRRAEVNGSCCCSSGVESCATKEEKLVKVECPVALPLSLKGR